MKKYFNEDAELHYVNTLVQFPQLINQAIIEPEEISNAESREVYSVLKDMRSHGESVNLVTVAMRLDTPMKILQEKWCSEYSSLSKFHLYEEKIREMTVLRKLVNTVETSGDPKKIIDVAKDLANKLVFASIPTLEEDFDEYKKNWDEKIERKKTTGSVGLITGFTKADARGWFYPGELCILAARSSVGKSAFALNVAVNAAMYSQNVLFFSAEMTKQSLIDRILSRLTMIPVSQFKSASNEYGFEEGQRLMKDLQALSLIDLPQLTSEKICSMVRGYGLRSKVDLVVVDYLQYLRDPIKTTNNDRIGQMTNRFKAMAKELGCCVLALSQVSREAVKSDEGMPQLHHLRDSGNIEQDADIVLMLNREKRDSEIAKIYVAKARDGVAEEGETLKFLPQFTLFENAVPKPTRAEMAQW